METGFIGLGAMGQPMARNLAGAGIHLTVYNRTPERAEALADLVEVAPSIAEVAQDRDIVVTMLSDDQAVEQVVFGTPDETGKLTPGLLACLSSDALHISMSTISVDLSRRLSAAHQAAGQGYVAAPVFGRPEAAAAKQLWVVAAGPAADVQRGQAIFDAVGAGSTVVGEEPWQANVVKLAGNFTIAAMIETLGEAFALVRRSNIDAARFLEVINSALFKSPIYKNYGAIIAEERFEPAGFKLKLGLKDARLALRVADESAVPMPLANLIHDHMLSLLAAGQGDLDWSSFARVAAARSGLPARK